MTEQQPMGTGYTREPAAPTQRSAAEDEQKRLNQQVYDFRKTCDPLVYEHVIAFHQFANTSDEAFATLQADYTKRAAEMLPPPDVPEGEASRRG
jgi:hypothetical protein